MSCGHFPPSALLYLLMAGTSTATYTVAFISPRFRAQLPERARVKYEIGSLSEADVGRWRKSGSKDRLSEIE